MLRRGECEGRGRDESMRPEQASGGGVGGGGAGEIERDQHYWRDQYYYWRETIIIREARRIKWELLARIGEVSASTDISVMRHKILNLEGDVENFYQSLKEIKAHTAAEDLGDPVGLEFKTLKQKIWDKIGSEAKEFGADVGPEDSVSNAGSSITVSSEAALVEIDLTLQREELRLKAQQADLEAQRKQSNWKLNRGKRSLPCLTLN